ncbi:MAG TPA: 50S ribosomal protein L29 [Candidatus Paceibacterota bacterium]|nr:50S ribosomal protein L29 [Candidatus Paceibacterota bacterium]
MTKKHSLANNSPEELAKMVSDKKEELRALRFSTSGSKNHNVKLSRELRKQTARALTELNKRHA